MMSLDEIKRLLIEDKARQDKAMPCPYCYCWSGWHAPRCRVMTAKVEARRRGIMAWGQ